MRRTVLKTEHELGAVSSHLSCRTVLVCSVYSWTPLVHGTGKGPDGTERDRGLGWGRYARRSDTVQEIRAISGADRPLMPMSQCRYWSWWQDMRTTNMNYEVLIEHKYHLRYREQNRTERRKLLSIRVACPNYCSIRAQPEERSIYASKLTSIRGSNLIEPRVPNFIEH